MKKNTKKKKKDKKEEEETICLLKGQIKTLIDEAREGGVCVDAADFINEIDEEFKESKKKSKKKKKKSFIDRWF